MGEFMKGIILAAGGGSRLGAPTLGMGEHSVGLSKPLIPTYDKPTIYYPLANLIAAGIRDVLIITSPGALTQFQNLLGDGSDIGITISYEVQHEAKGTAQALTIGETFIGDDNVAIIFGDNIFSGETFTQSLRDSFDTAGASIFAYEVPDAHKFGVVEFDDNMRAISIEEKPEQPKSNYAIVGVYFYSSDAVEIAKNIAPSARGELEITSVTDAYLTAGRLSVGLLDNDTGWFDTGTVQSLNDAANYVRIWQDKHGQLLGSPEAAAYKAGFINREQLLELARPLAKSTYGQLLTTLANNN